MKKTDDIELLFSKLRNYFGDESDMSHHMFHMLVDVTLAYRDELIKKNEPTLTVEETKNALNKFMEVMKTKEFPKDLEIREKQLVMRWLDQVKQLRH